MEEALRKLLADYQPLKDLVGSRIYWGDFPQGTSGDAVRLNRITGGALYTMTGEASIAPATVQVSTRAETLKQAWAIADAVQERLSGFRGLHAGVTFNGIFLNDDGELPSEKVGATLYRGTRSDYRVWASA